jgi:hypothetical protein
MTDQTSTLRIQADASGVEAGVATAKRSLASLGGAAAQAGKQGADGLAALGSGGDAAARKVDSATKSMVGSIQRQIAAMEAGGTSSRQYQESLAKLRGIDVSALKPYLDQLDAAKVKATAAAKATDGLKSAASGISGTLAALGVSLSAGAFITFVTNINNGVDALNDLKDATGASIENISALEDVAKRTGTSFDTVGTALIKLNQGLSAAKPGSDTERAIKAIGLSVSELKALDPAEAFRRIAVSLSGFEDDANKARLTQELFGKSLKEVAPLLKDLADQGQLNATVTTAQAEAAEKLNKQIFNLQKNAIDAGRAITGALVPALSDGVDRFLLAQKHAGGLLETLALYARLDYSKGIQGNLGQVETQIAALEERAGRITSVGAQRGNDKMIADLRAQAAYLKELRQIKILEDQGDNSDAVSRKFLNRKTSVGDVLAGDGGKAAGAAAAKALQDQNRELAEQAKLLATLSGVNGDYQEQLTRLQVVRKSQNISDARYSELVTELIDKQPMVKALYADQEKSAKAWADQSAASAKAVAELSKEYDAYVKTLDASAIAVGNQLQKLQDEELATAIAAQQNISLAQAIEQVTIARLSEAQTKAYANGDQEAGDAIKREIEARKKLATAIGGKEVREANKKAAEDAAKEWQKTADKINDSITDALMRGFESGKGFAENLRDSVVNMFKTMVLRPVVQATVGGTLGVLGMNAAAAQSADSGGGGGGLLNTASDLKTLYGMKDWFTDFGSAAASSVIRGGEIAYSAGFEKIGSNMMSVSEVGNFAAVSDGLNTLGSGLSYFSAAVSASQGKWGSAAGTVIGTAFGGPLGGAVGSFLGGLVDNIFGGDGGPKLASTGDAIRRYDKGGALTENATNGAWFFTNTDDANKLLDGLESRYQKAAKALGIGTVATQFDYGSNNRGNFALAGAAGNSRANTGEIAYSAEAMQVAASRAVFAALQGSELPKYLSGLLDNVGDINALSQAQIDDVLNTAQAFKGLHDVMVQMPFEALHDLSYNAAKGLIEFSGGLDKLTQNLGTYYENFYSAEEKKAQTLANITKTLTDAGALTKTTRTAIPGEFDVRVGAQGDTSLEQRYATSLENLDMPKTREEFRALAESLQDLGGEAAQKAYAALLSVSGAFASITPAATDATAALEKDLAARASWQQKLDVLTGKTTERALSLQNDLAGTTDAATKALIQQVHAQQDLADATAKAAANMATLAAATASIQGSKTQIYNVENAIAPERAALTAAQEAWAGAIKSIKDIAVDSFGQSQSDVAKWGAAEIEGFKVEDFADSEFFDAVQQALTDYWADKAALVTANDTFAKAEAAAKDAAAKAAIDSHHSGLTHATQIRDAELALKSRLYELTGDAGKLADVVKEQRDIIAAGLSTTQADLQRQIWAAEDGARSAGGAGKDILAERNSLQAELNALTDTAAQALSRQRDALDESNRALFDNIQATKAAKAIADQAATLQDRLAIATGASTATEISRKNELATALDFSNRIMLESIYAAEDLAAANAKTATAARDAAAATLQNASTNASQALAGVQRAVDAQKKLAQVQVDVAQESVANLTSIFDTLKSSVAQLYGSVDSTAAQSAGKGSAFIAQALSTAKATGYFPDADDLADAVAAATQGVSGGVYASKAEADFARLALAGDLASLKDLSKTELTTAEKSLEAARNQLTVLDKTLETAREQLDAVNGVNTSVLSVAAALDAFGAALGGLQAAKNASVAQYAGTATAAVPTGSRSYIDYKAGTAQLSGNDKPMATAELAKNVAQSWANAIGNPAVEDNVRRFMRDLELTPSALGIVLPGFASGINYVPHDMTARIHEGEAVVPAAYNPFNPNAASAGNARLEALVAGLTAEVQRLQTIVNDGNRHQRRTADAVNGNPEMPMLVETV